MMFSHALLKTYGEQRGTREGGARDGTAVRRGDDVVTNELSFRYVVRAFLPEIQFDTVQKRKRIGFDR